MIPRRASAITMACILAVLGGCQIGARALPVSNAHYSDAVRVSQSEQFLANLVRLRYRDLPVFLAVTSISTQFELAASSDLRGSAGSQGGDAPDFTAALGISYAERPTISFSILGGEAFQKRLLKPLDIAAISLVAESGWRIDRVLQLTTEQMNGLRNAPTASGPTPSTAPVYEQFMEVTALLEDLRGSSLADTDYQTRFGTFGGAIPVSRIDGAAMIDASRAGLEFAGVPDRKDLVRLTGSQRRLVLRLSPQSDHDPRVRRIRELLHLKSGVRVFDVVALENSRFDPLRPDQPLAEIAVDTRSLMGVLYYLSNGVEAPEKHIAAGIVTRTTRDSGASFDWKELLGDLLTVHSSRDRPKNAAIAVEYRGYWFYVADDDQTTKTTFMLLSELFALQAGEVSQDKPVLTLSVGN